MGSPIALGKPFNHPRLRLGKKEQKTALQKDILMRGLHQKADKAKCVFFIFLRKVKIGKLFHSFITSKVFELQGRESAWIVDCFEIF